MINDRQFIQEAKLKINEHFSYSKVGEVFEKCMKNTLDTTIKSLEDGTFILTGDIPAMWLRDSVCQVRPFLLFAKENKEIQTLLIGLVKKQLQQIAIDPYANAFNEQANSNGHQTDKTEMGPMIWERKYEIDSLCYPIQLAYLLWKMTGRDDQFTEEFEKVAQIIIELWQTEQHHEEQSSYRFERETTVQTDTLERNGKGTLTSYTGMTWSGFRPSDDACSYGYLVPSNMFAVVVLTYLDEILQTFYSNEPLRKEVAQLKKDIQEGIEKYAVIQHKEFGEVYAYEVDGLGNYLLMDDANIPSLMALPLLDYCQSQDSRYVNTRKFLLSSKNPYFYVGEEANGIGSPHTPSQYIWPIALSVQGLTSEYESEKRDIINTLLRTDAGKSLMHESFNVNNSSEYTREWFSWANMMFCELVLDVVGINFKTRK